VVLGSAVSVQIAKSDFLSAYQLKKQEEQNMDTNGSRCRSIIVIFLIMMAVSVLVGVLPLQAHGALEVACVPWKGIYKAHLYWRRWG
jgi:hypothetical protein